MADLDVVVVGAGFAGIYAVHAFRWSWSERYPAQPEVLRYLNHVADRFGLWPDIQLSTRVTAAIWDGENAQWTVRTDDGAQRTARFAVMATGCLSAYQVPALRGLESFGGPWYHTSRWPREGADLSGLRVGLVGTGFDAMTGALARIDIRGVDGLPLTQKWAVGPRAYLGVATSEFPNMFLVTGPGSPSVLSNMVVSIEQHVEWIRDFIRYAGSHGYSRVEATGKAERAWGEHVIEVAYSTLFPMADSWYVGANIPGKPRVFSPYIGGVGAYRTRCDEVASAGYEGFVLTVSLGDSRRLAVSISVNPQARQVLDGRAAAGVPPTWEQTPQEVRAGFAPVREMIGPGPDVASVRDIVIPGQAGGIPARVYSPVPDSPGTVVYYHGGGWVLGSVDDWDACVRALAVAAGCDVVSVDYRLAPEHVFPAATDDAYDALVWVGAEMAGDRPIAVAGDSAGGNLAAVSALRARDSSGPALALQALIYPVTDHDFDRESYRRYDGREFVLNARDMAWFWDHYTPDPAARSNPYASPLRAGDLSGLPPAWVLTAEHDPLRDEGFEYADRLRAAGVPVEHRHYGSQIHGFFTMVNVIDDGDKAAAEAGAAIRAAFLAAAT